MSAPVAGPSLLDQQVGQVGGFAAVGLVGVVLTAAYAEHPWVPAVVALVTIVVAGPVLWVVHRSLARTDWDTLPRVSAPGLTRGAGLRRGLIVGLVAAAGGGLVMVLLDRGLGGGGVGSTWAVVLLTLAVARLAAAHDLRAWQDRHGLVVCTRLGSRRSAWTSTQARDRLVVTPGR